MNRSRNARRITALIVAVTAYIFSGVAQADPPGRVARLGYITGSVSFSPAGEDDWVHASLNRPLITGDRLWVVPGGRAELQLGASSIRIGSGTAVNLLNLDDRVIQIELTQGTVNIRVRRYDPGQTLEIDTPNLAFSVRRAGTYRITVDPNGDSTTVLVRDGQGDVYGDGAAYLVNQGASYRYFGTGLRDFDLLDRVAYDEFDRWSSERDRRIAASISARYVSADVIGYADLDAYGAWRPVTGYGSVWFPKRVATGWAPYRDGHWSWIEPWGWTWVDDAPWGFTVSHYGRWANMDGAWGWVPGPVHERAVYAPALVAFVGGTSGFSISASIGPSIGWFPLGPREVYRPSYAVSREYFTRVNSSNTAITNVNINNYYNNSSVTNVTYVNQRVPGAIVAVPQQAFVQSQPIARAAVRLNPEQAISQSVVQVAAVAPVQRSLIGNAAASVKPPVAAVERAVVARTPPPPPPAAFTARQSILNATPGKPLTAVESEKLRPQAPTPQTPAPRVIAAPPAPPTTSMSTVQPQRVAPGNARGGRPEPTAPGTAVEAGRPVPGSPAAATTAPGAAPKAEDRVVPPGQRGRPEPQVKPTPQATPSPAPAPQSPVAAPKAEERVTPGQRSRPEPQAQPTPPTPPAAPAAAPKAEDRIPPGQRGRPQPQVQPPPQA
ncbi:MAG: DUF6600 domain-containing protein, partial [Casimicrobiaceae bacterium]